eukprot:gene8662-11588_t
MGEEFILKLKIEDQGAVPSGMGGEAELTITLDAETPISFMVPVGQDLELPVNLPHAGMNGKHHRSVLSLAHQGCHNFGQPCRIIRIFRTMHGGKDKAAGRQAEIIDDGRMQPCARHGMDHGVMHHVADMMHTGSDSFRCQVGDGRLRRRQQQCRDMVGHDPVDFLGHASVEGAQARFDMRHRYMQLCSGQRAGE